MMPLVRHRSLSIVLALTVSACGSVESSSFDASESRTPAATPSPPVAPTPPGALLAPNDSAQVVTTDLVMRSAPGGGPESEVYPGALDTPTLLYIVDGPVPASGYDWYLVYPFTVSISNPPEHWRLGWVAAGSLDGEAWIAPAAPSCPRADFDGLSAISWMGALACYGDDPLTLEGSFGGSSYTVPGVISPGWLVNTYYWLWPLGTAPDAPLPGLTGFLLHVPDAATLDYDLGIPIRVRGHFDDPAAQTCIAGPLPGEPTPGSSADEILADQEVVLYCRASFIVTDATPLGP
jgi:hypothetical protein